MTSLSVPFLDLKRQIAEERSDIHAAFDRVLQRGQVLLGPELEAFEQEFATWNGVEHAVGVSSGCDAIALLLRAAGIGPGDDVVVPAFTCPATWMGVCQAGARPIPAEVDPVCGLLDPASVTQAITPATRAIMAVHLYGAPAPLGPLRQVCRDRGLYLFVDSAQSTGLTVGGSRAVALADGAAFSFYPTKNLAALDDAGCVVTPHQPIADAVRSRRNYGKDAQGNHQQCGINARMGELQAAVLRFRLARVEAQNQRRAELAALYLESLNGLPGLGLPTSSTASVGNSDSSVWHLFPVKVQAPQQRDQVATALLQEGIGTAVHYREAFHTCPALQDLFSGRRYQIAETLADTVLSLPLNPWLQPSEILQVSATLRNLLERR